MPKIYITCDHAGFDLKNQLAQQLALIGIELIDLVNLLDKDDDYPDSAKLLAVEIKKDLGIDQHSLGIAICGSGQGICIALNRFDFIRASMPRNIIEAKKTREHNQSNILCLGSEAQYFDDKLSIVLEFLNTPYQKVERHFRRIIKMDNPNYSNLNEL